METYLAREESHIGNKCKSYILYRKDRQLMEVDYAFLFLVSDSICMSSIFSLHHSDCTYDYLVISKSVWILIVLWMQVVGIYLSRSFCLGYWISPRDLQVCCGLWQKRKRVLKYTGKRNMKLVQTVSKKFSFSSEMSLIISCINF